MKNKKESFQLAATNIEIDIVRNEINLLRKYAQMSDAAAREQFMTRFHPIMRKIIETGKLTPTELIPRLERAIKLDKYRPRNLSLFMLAISPDLYNIRGKFDTFDQKLSQMFNASVRDDFAIRKEFNSATLNRFDLSQRVAAQWIRRLEQHPDLVAAARNATPDDALPAYSALLDALVTDFCKEYNIYRKEIAVNLVEQFLPDEIEKQSDDCAGFVDTVYKFILPSNTPSSEYDKIIQAINNGTRLPSCVVRIHVIKISMSNIIRGVRNMNISLFDNMLSTFAHEMQHVTDAHMPRVGALGPQVNHMDKQTYIDLTGNVVEYHKSATELGAYAVTNAMLALLSKQNS